MRVVQVSTGWFPDTVGGQARVVSETTRALAARGHTVVVLARDGSGPARTEGALAELLGDEHEVGVQRSQSLDDGVLRSLVDRGRVVAALASPQDRLALLPRWKHLERGLDVGDAQPARLEPGRHAATGWKRSPASGLG